MNRLGLENLMADLTGDMALQLTSDYIIYRAGEDIHGIWIFETTDRDRIAAKLQECCRKAMEEDNIKISTPSETTTKDHSSPQRSLNNHSNDSSSADPLTRMLSEAMTRARVSETSGTPLASQSNMQANSSPAVQNNAVQSPPVNQSHVNGQSSKSDIPSFLLAIISKEQEQNAGSKEDSPSLGHQNSNGSESTQTKLLSTLTGSGKTSPTMDRHQINRQSGPPLSAEFLPPSVMPSGLYSNNSRPNGVQASQIMQHQSPSMAAALLNRPNGMPAHGSPLQAPAFVYSPGMMPSPLAMPMMRPTPPLPFQHPMGPSMGMPLPPPPPQPPMSGASFPADAMHAAMGAVGFMQQQQRGFMGQGTEVLSKDQFSQEFLGLVKNDPQFMDVLYSNYEAVIARRG
ncbi:hypothetical protein BGZ46_005028 [Entomortierella lignicola]|nr:hypothetical protein BGZ46_005028 [Entomortierella lignicola]